MNHRVSSDGLDLKDQVVAVNRVTKVVKGGKNFSFSALVVVGDGRGVVGFGQGKAKEASAAVTKGTEAAKKALIRVPLVNGTVPHETIGRYGRGRIVIRPASTGTGVIAGGAARAIMELAGVQNVLTKSIGTSNPQNLVRATIAGLMSLRSLEDVARARGKSVEEIGSEA